MRSILGPQSRRLGFVNHLAWVVNPDGSESEITSEMCVRVIGVGVRRNDALVDKVSLVAIVPKASLGEKPKFWRIGVPQSCREGYKRLEDVVGVSELRRPEYSVVSEHKPGVKKMFRAVTVPDWESSEKAERIWEDTFGDPQPDPEQWACADVENEHYDDDKLEVWSCRELVEGEWAVLAPRLPESWRDEAASLLPGSLLRPKPVSEAEAYGSTLRSRLEETGWLESGPEPENASQNWVRRVWSRPWVRRGVYATGASLVGGGLLWHYFTRGKEQVSSLMVPTEVEESKHGPMVWKQSKELVPTNALNKSDLLQLERPPSDCTTGAVIVGDKTSTRKVIKDVCHGGSGGLLCIVRRETTLGYPVETCYRFGLDVGYPMRVVWDGVTQARVALSCRAHCDPPATELDRVGHQIFGALRGTTKSDGSLPANKSLPTTVPHPTNGSLAINGSLPTDNGSVLGGTWTEVNPEPVGLSAMVIGPEAARELANYPRRFDCSGACSNCTRQSFEHFKEHDCTCAFGYIACQSYERGITYLHEEEI
ncbi:hypothetical protein GNI_175210, partial [Gregarina niphandrodes]